MYENRCVNGVFLKLCNLIIKLGQFKNDYFYSGIKFCSMLQVVKILFIVYKSQTEKQN